MTDEELRQQLAEQHGLPGWWPLTNDEMPDREWTNIEHLRNQLWLANDAAEQLGALLAEAREAMADLINWEPCRWQDNYCQTHGSAQEGGGCPHERAKNIAARSTE